MAEDDSAFDDDDDSDDGDGDDVNLMTGDDI
jgi:hypothetical protein